MRNELRLPDGRRIDYLELGDPAGVPAIYLHGSPSSAGEARWLHRPAAVHGVRLVSVDRPGYLRSERSPDPSLVGVAEDVAAVAEWLGLRRFAVVGFSGGAGYALATAHVAPDRVTVVHLGGGLGSLAGGGGRQLPLARRLMFASIAHAPALGRALFGGTFRLLRRGLEKRLDAPADAARWFFDGPARGAQVAAVEEYVRTSDPEELRSELSDWAAGTRATQAIVDDISVYARPWPFALSGIATPVELWHGLDDPAAPVVFAERIAAELPNARPHLFAGEGHFVFLAHGDEVAASIKEHA